MRWMNGIENPNATGSLTKYIQDSTGMGWHSDNSDNIIHKTGIDVDTKASNKVKNIYDMAGNVFEWTMESYYTLRRVYRGGDYSFDGANVPVSGRNSGLPSNSDDGIGFRVALYL